MEERDPDITLTANDLSGGVVYAWRRGETWLYVGRSGKGLRRPFSHDHEMVRNKSRLRPTDTLSVWRCTFDESEAMEMRLIKLHQPTYNLIGLDENRIASSR